MKRLKWIGACVALAVAVSVTACDDELPMEPTADTANVENQKAAAGEDGQEAEGVGEELPGPSFLVTTPDGTLSDPTLAAADYCEDTKALEGDCLVSTTLGDGYFVQLNIDESSGTGVFDPFVRISANTALQQGVNSSGRPLPWDENTSGQFTRDLRLDELPTLECPVASNGDYPESPYSPGDICREIALDINEEGSGDEVFISLDALRIYLSENIRICDDPDDPDNNAGGPTDTCRGNGGLEWDFDPTDPTFGLAAGELIWWMDETTNSGIGLDFTNDNGSGRADLVVYIRNDVFGEAGETCPYDQGMGDDCPYFVHVYSHFGADDQQGDGFEEWDVRVLPIVTVSKTVTTIADKEFEWEITKSVDPPSWALFDGESATSEYSIDVQKTGNFIYKNWRVSGEITIVNPAQRRRDVVLIESVEDVLGGEGPVAVDCGVTFPYELVGNDGELVCTWGGDGVSVADGAFGTNTATVTLATESGGGVFEGTADYDASGTPDEDGVLLLNEVNVTDVNDDGETRNFGPTEGTTFTYEKTFDCSRLDFNTNPDSYAVDNTATIDETGQNEGATSTITCYRLIPAKDAAGLFNRYYDWDIDKTQVTLDNPPSLILPPDTPFDVDYSVTVTVTGSTDNDWRIAGEIDIQNPHPTRAATLTAVTDVMDGAGPPPDFGPIDATCPSLTVAAGGTLTCSYAFGPVTDSPDSNPFGQTNTATATQQLYTFRFDGPAGGSADGTTDYTATADPSFTLDDEIDECIDVTDDQFGSLGTACADESPKTFDTYTLTVGPYPACTETEFCNEASFVTTDTGATGSDEVCIPVSVPCPSCTLTPGYWKTHNDTFWGGARPDPAWELIGTPLWDDPPDGNAEQSIFADSDDGMSPKFSLALDGTYIDALWTPPAGNTFWNLSFHYIAAELNLLNGASIVGDGATALAAARAFFADTNPQDWEADGYTAAQLTTWKSRLAEFNEGTNWFVCTPDATTLQWENVF